MLIKRKVLGFERVYRTYPFCESCKRSYCRDEGGYGYITCLEGHNIENICIHINAGYMGTHYRFVKEKKTT